MTDTNIDRLLWELHEDNEPIVELAIDHANKALAPADEALFLHRMQTDENFRAVAAPVLESMKEPPLSDQEFAVRYQAFRRHVGLSSPQADEELLDFQRHAAKRPAVAWRVAKIAAVIFVSVIGLSLGTTTFLQYRYMESHVAPARGYTRLTLPDGSVAELAPGSRVRLLKNMRSIRGTFRREVWMQGEVSFTVRHSPEARFTVHAQGARITVTGTRFAVREFTGGVEVRIGEGTVVVQPLDAESGEELGNPRELRAGQSANVMSGQIVVSGAQVPGEKP